MTGIVENPPDASALVESLRAFGYGFDAAVSDLIDNSVAAAARKVDISLFWDGRDSSVAVADTGSGMAPAELFNAMKLGSRSPLEERAAGDLGRFGLGMKTASFSQCRRLTVASRTSRGRPHWAVWDLDLIAETGRWSMTREPTDRARSHVDELMTGAGTVVVWEKPDRLVGDVEVGDEWAHDAFLERAEGLIRHLGMTYCDRLAGRKSVRISVNGNAVPRWDPFLEEHAATQRLPVEHLRTVGGRKIAAQPYVLPHHSRLTAEEHSEAGGPHGWNEHQGFYVFRNGRLIVSGGWLGLGFRREDHYKLARVRIDLDNRDDHIWHIDVRKEVARVPDVLVPDLKRIAQAVRRQAESVYRHRGKVIQRRGESDSTFVWQAKRSRGRTSYMLNRRHPIIEELSRSADRSLVNALLRLVEETVPINDMTLDVNRSPESVAQPFDRTSSKELVEIARSLYLVLLARTESHRLAIAQLAAMEPAASRPDLVGLIEEEFTDGAR